jgi:predicted RNase H-like HicB family nuclease
MSQPEKERVGYHINVFFSAADGGYIADIPDLNACSGFGESPEEAVAQVVLARDAWLAVARETGREIPPPRYRPAIYAS